MIVETLKFKYIAPYIPYRLGFKLSEVGIFNLDSEFGTPSEARSTMYITDVNISDKKVEMSVENINGWGVGLAELENFIPLLHPLSDLTKEIFVNGKRFVPIEKLKELKICDSDEDVVIAFHLYDTDSFSKVHKLFELLFEWHFDVFGLIDKGLALNIND